MLRPRIEEEAAASRDGRFVARIEDGSIECGLERERASRELRIRESPDALLDQIVAEEEGVDNGDVVERVGFESQRVRRGGGVQQRLEVLDQIDEPVILRQLGDVFGLLRGPPGGRKENVVPAAFARSGPVVAIVELQLGQLGSVQRSHVSSQGFQILIERQVGTDESHTDARCGR